VSAPPVKIIPPQDVHRLLMLSAEMITCTDLGTFSSVTFARLLTLYYCIIFIIVLLLLLLLHVYFSHFHFNPLLFYYYIIIIIIIVLYCIVLLYLHCSVSVIGLVAVDSAHK
jgi:hypothetical protein